MLFGAIAAGRAVTTAFQQIDETHFVLDIPGIGHVNHLTLFLTSENALPDNFGAAIHFSLPPYSSWEYLGGLLNTKPSATFRLSLDKTNPQIQESIGRIGVSIEPILALEQMQCARVENITPEQQRVLDKVGSKLYTNLQEYVASHAAPIQLPNGTSEMAVSCKAFDKWMESLNRRIRLNKRFWDDI